jgi:hypothetical protein
LTSDFEGVVLLGLVFDMPQNADIKKIAVMAAAAALVAIALDYGLWTS